jgi:opacity protein-like surface antigen
MIILCFLLLFAATGNTFAREKIIVKDYTYQASEDDSRNAAREKAVTQLKKQLLRETGEYLHSEQVLSFSNSTQEYTERIQSVTAGIVKMEILEEEWNSEKLTFYIKAKMTVDPDEVRKRLFEVQKAEEENAKLRQAIEYLQKQNIAGTTGEYRRLVREYQQNTDLLNSLSQQYFEVECSLAGATIKIDDEEFVPVTNGKFQKRLSFGSHKYVIEAPLYYPVEGYVEITREKQPPLRPALKPMFGGLKIHSAPNGAVVFIDGVERGVTPLVIPQLRSGNHTIAIRKDMYLPATEMLAMTDGASMEKTIRLIPNFAHITLRADGDIYINDKKEETTSWSGRLLPGIYKVEVKKPSHRTTIKNIEVKAQEDQTIRLDAPTPIYGSLDISTNDIKADIYIDGLKRKETTPAVVSDILIGTHRIKLVAPGYADDQQTVKVEEGQVRKVIGYLEKSATLRIDANVSAAVSIDGRSLKGTTPQTLSDLPVKRTKLVLTRTGYRPLEKTVRLKAGDNYVYGKLKKELRRRWFVDYAYSKAAPLGFNIGYCKRWGLYLGFKTNNKHIVKEASSETVDFNNKEYYRLSMTTGPMLRLCNWCYLYCGAGYGIYGAAYQMGNQKDYYCPEFQKGLDVEGGMKIRLSFLSLSVGYNTLFSGNPQQFRDVNVGVGLNF